LEKILAYSKYLITVSGSCFITEYYQKMHDCSLEYAETAADGFSHLPVHLQLGLFGL